MIYLDNNATTKPSPGATEAVLTYLRDCYYNPSASTAAILGADTPRRDASFAMARLLNAEEPSCFVFTSGATESNNWILSSIVQSHSRGKIVISAIEHSSISEPASVLSHKGFEVVEVPVDKLGVVRLDVLAQYLTEDTILVSIMAANNETGVLEPLPEIGRLVRELSPSALLHTDATQAVGKVHLDLQGELHEVDLLSFSAHKFHGPKGVGGLYIRPGIELPPLLRGGGQEAGMRAGTTNTPALAGLAAAAFDIDFGDMDRLKCLRDEFEAKLLQAIPTVVFHSQYGPRLPNTSCLSIMGKVGEDLAQMLCAEGVIVGTGSACSAGANHPPKTLLAMGVDYPLAASTIRISLSRYNTSEEILITVDTLCKILNHH